MIDPAKVYHENDHNMTLAVAKIVTVFREGLSDHLTLPEIHSEAEEATHFLLGCDQYNAVLMVAGAIHAGRLSGARPRSLEIVQAALTSQLVDIACAVVNAGGPIGEHDCGRVFSE